MRWDDNSKIDQTMITDHSVQQFTVTVRSMSEVHPDTLKRLIQSRYEVIECTQVDNALYSRKP